MGTTNPTQSLDIVGRIQFGGTGVDNALYIRRVTDNATGVTLGYASTNANQELSLRHNSGTGNFTIHLNGTGGEQGNGFNEKFRFTSGGSLGIGRSNPSTELDVFGGANLTNRVLIGSATSTGTSNQKLQVTGGAYVSDSVGIGTTNPTQTLDVNGNIGIAGTLNFLSRTSGTYISFGSAGTLSAIAGGTWLSFSNTIEGFGALRTRGYFGLIGPTGIENAYIERDDANIIAQRNAGVGQTFRIYNTYTSSTNFERANLGWNNNDFIVGTEKGSSIGTARNLYLQTDGTTRVAITTTGNVGVGTLTPQFATDINGDARVQGSNKMRFGGNSSTTNFYIQYNSTTNSLDFVAG